MKTVIMNHIFQTMRVSCIWHITELLVYVISQLQLAFLSLAGMPPYGSKEHEKIGGKPQKNDNFVQHTTHKILNEHNLKKKNFETHILLSAKEIPVLDPQIDQESDERGPSTQHHVEPNNHLQSPLRKTILLTPTLIRLAARKFMSLS